MKGEAPNIIGGVKEEHSHFSKNISSFLLTRRMKIKESLREAKSPFQKYLPLSFDKERGIHPVRNSNGVKGVR